MTDIPSAARSIQPIVDQMRAASAANLYYVALITALTLPDICAALEAENGKSTRSKHKAWLVVHGGRSEEAADIVYGLRCSLLHEGSGYPHGQTLRVAFVEPRPGAASPVHGVNMLMGEGQVLWYGIPEFVEEVALAVEAWTSKYGAASTVLRNLEKVVRVRLEGLPPFVAGAPVIA